MSDSNLKSFGRSELCREWDEQKLVTGFSLKKLERLALPKGIDILCEESQEPARVSFN